MVKAEKVLKLLKTGIFLSKVNGAPVVKKDAAQRAALLRNVQCLADCKLTLGAPAARRYKTGLKGQYIKER